MYLHVNAKLGLAGRLALVHAVEEGLKGGRGSLQRVAGDGASLVAPLAGWRLLTGGAAGSLESAAPLATAARLRAAGADL